MSNSHCDARQTSDQMTCSTCGLAWDTNDPYPPACGKKTGKYRGKVKTVWRSTPPPSWLNGYSIFTTLGDSEWIVFGWAYSAENMLTITLSALGFDDERRPPEGMEIVIYDEPSISAMCVVPRERVSFSQVECENLVKVLTLGGAQTIPWQGVIPTSALRMRVAMEAKC